MEIRFYRNIEIKKIKKDFTKKETICLARLLEILKNTDDINKIKDENYECKHVESDLWEIKKGKLRVCYFIKIKGLIYIVYIYRKETQKMPLVVKETSLKRIKEIKDGEK